MINKYIVQRETDSALAVAMNYIRVDRARMKRLRWVTPSQ